MTGPTDERPGSTPVSRPADLTGQTAVVTGAAGGMGTVICEVLAREGADVVAADVDNDGLQAVSERVRGRGSDCETVLVDVADRERCQALRRRALEAFDSVEVLVNVAGIESPARDKSVPEITLEEWQRVFDVNLTGTFLVTQAFWDHMVDTGHGRVVCIGSIAGRQQTRRGGPAYCVSKDGVHSLAKWLAKRGAEHGIRVNAIAPGPVWSPMTRGNDRYSDDMTPVERLGEPDDIAEGVLYLASQQSDFVTGVTLDINGGLHME